MCLVDIYGMKVKRWTYALPKSREGAHETDLYCISDAANYMGVRIRNLFRTKVAFILTTDLPAYTKPSTIPRHSDRKNVDETWALGRWVTKQQFFSLLLTRGKQSNQEGKHWIRDVINSIAVKFCENSTQRVLRKTRLSNTETGKKGREKRKKMIVSSSTHSSDESNMSSNSATTQPPRKRSRKRKRIGQPSFVSQVMKEFRLEPVPLDERLTEPLVLELQREYLRVEHHYTQLCQELEKLQRHMLTARVKMEKEQKKLHALDNDENKKVPKGKRKSPYDIQLTQEEGAVHAWEELMTSLQNTLVDRDTKSGPHRLQLLKQLARQLSAHGSQEDLETEEAYRSRIGLSRLNDLEFQSPNKAMVSLDCVKDLINIVKSGCSECKSLGILGSQVMCLEIVTVGITLCCKLCCSIFPKHLAFVSETAHKISISQIGKHHWLGSRILPNSTLEVNTDFILSSLTCGLLDTKIVNLVSNGKFGKLSHRSCERVMKKLSPIANIYMQKLIDKEVRWENTFLSATTVMGDTRYGAPTRHGIPTSKATTSILSHRTGGILGLLNTDRKTMHATGEKLNRNLESYAAPIVFGKVVKELDNVFGYIHDSSSTGNKIVNDFSTDIAPIANLHDSWHYRKIPRSGWNAALSKLGDKNSPRRKPLKKIGFGKIWNHITYAHMHGFGDALVSQGIIRNAVKHYQDDHTNCRGGKCEDNPLYVLEDKYRLGTTEQVKVFTNFVNTHSTMETMTRGKLVHHRWGSRNYPCEMIHNIMLVYAPKRVAFGPKAYNMRIAFAVLDHTENLKNYFVNDRTCHWRSVVKELFAEDLNQT